MQGKRKETNRVSARERNREREWMRKRKRA